MSQDEQEKPGHAPAHSGGCQCGAVRFSISGALGRASICHCRMCQKAFGAFYAPLVAVGDAELTWTRGALKHFQSSNLVKRGFCADCGTPLTYEAPVGGVALAIGAFDHPELIKPTIQYGTEARIDWLSDLDGLSSCRTDEDEDEGVQELMSSLHSLQHPDHDTAAWPLKDEQE